jgi:cytochrome c
MFILVSFSFSVGDPSAGKKVFRKCKACHAVGKGAKNRVGPTLNGIYYRKIGTGNNYKYSQSMIKAGQDGFIWDDDTLAKFIAYPKKVIPNTKMSFSGIKKGKDVINLVAYLKTFS